MINERVISATEQQQRQVLASAYALRTAIEGGFDSSIIADRMRELVTTMGGNPHALNVMTPEGCLLYVISLVLTQ